MSEGFDGMPKQYKAFHAIMAKSGELGIPTHYQTDLAIDAHSIYTREACSFVWVVRDYGTHTFYCNGTGIELLHTVIADYGRDARCFVWDAENIPMNGREQEKFRYMAVACDEHLREVEWTEGLEFLAERMQ